MNQAFLIFALLAEPPLAERANLVVQSVQVMAPPTLRGGWVEITPLSGGAGQKVVSLDPTTVRTTIGLAEGIRVFEICAGGIDVATVCARRTSDDQSPFAPTLDSGQIARGRVMSHTDPVVRARIALVFAQLAASVPFTAPLSKSGEQLVRTLFTDAEGRYNVSHIAPGEYRIEATLPTGPVLQSAAFRIEKPKRTSQPPATIELPEIRAPRGLSFEVLAQDDRGELVGAARVSLSQGDSLDSMQSFEATTDATGRAQFSGLRIGEEVRLACMETQHETFRDRFPTPPEYTTCTMARLSTVAALVLDERDHPIATGTGVIRVEHATSKARTSANGELTLRKIPPGPHELIISAPGYESISTHVEPEPGETLRAPTIHLPPAASFVGKLTDQETGLPVPGATVSIILPVGGESASDTDEHGRFQLRLPRNDEARVRITAAGYATIGIPIPRSAEGNDANPFPVTIGRGGRIHVATWDEETDTACAGCTVVITGSDEPRTLTTDANGEATSDTIAPQTYVLIKEQAQATGTIVHVSGGDETRLAQVKAGTTVTVSFGDRTRWLTVQISPALEPGWLIATESRTRSDIVAPQRDMTYRIRRPTKGTLTLHGQRGTTRVRLAQIAEDFNDTTVRVLLPSTLVRGQLPNGNRGIIQVASDAVIAQVTTDENGSFTIPYLHAGVYSAIIPAGGIRAITIKDPGITELGIIK